MTPAIASTQPSLPPNAKVTNVKPASGNNNYLPTFNFNSGRNANSSLNTPSLPTNLASKLPPGAVITGMKKVTL